MKKFLKEIVVSLIVTIVTSVAGLLFGYLNLDNQSYILLAAVLLGTIPIVVLLITVGTTIYAKQELIRKNSVLLNRMNIENWAVIISQLHPGNENSTNSKYKIDPVYLEELKKSWNHKYERLLASLLQELYPKKTRPQIEKIMHDFLND